MGHHRRDFLPPLDTPKLSKSEVTVLNLAHLGITNQEISEATGLKLRNVEQTMRNARIKYRDNEQRKALGELKFSPSITHRGTVR